MTVTPHEGTRPAESDGDILDVVDHRRRHLRDRRGLPPRPSATPATRYVVLERRDRIGGTWDLFRYPGVRSDSSIFTLSWPWEPWTR